jgi:C4-dicarboxylate-specific signal transduction histidine kinase
MKILLSIIVALALVWLLIARPDRSAEQEKIRRQLAFEADSRSQALTLEMEKYRLASVLLTRSAIIESVLNSPGDNRKTLDRLGYLQALSGVKSLVLLRRGETDSEPPLQPPQPLLDNGAWFNGIRTAFQGSLGRAIYVDSIERPHYLFFTPIFTNQGQPEAILIATIDMGLIRDTWEGSAHRVALWHADDQLVFDNNIETPRRSITVERAHRQLDATLRVTGPAPGLMGEWMLRSSLVALGLLLGVLLIGRQFERRRLLTELAEQKAGEAARLETEVTQRTRELEIVQSQLMMTEKLALLGQMSASISHEINQPLAAIKNYSSSSLKLLDKNRISSVRDSLNIISDLTDRISRIVVHLRSFAHNEPSPVQPVLLNPLLSSAVSEFRDRFPAASSALHYEANPRESWVQAGEVRLLQVLGNLLTNAWLACRERSQPHLELSVYDEQDQIRVSVADNGPGIDSSLAESLFDAFVTSRKDGDGLGLGLTISRSFVESMGGTLSIAENFKPGTRFDIVLQKIPSNAA